MSVAALVYSNPKYVKGVENILITIVDNVDLFPVTDWYRSYVTTLPSLSVCRKFVAGSYYPCNFRVVFGDRPGSAKHASLKHVCWHSDTETCAA